MVGCEDETCKAKETNVVSLTYMSKVIADTRVLGISGTPGIGIYRLRFSIEFAVIGQRESDEAVSVSNLRADVFAGPSGGVCSILGYAEPESPLFLEPGKIAQSRPVLFHLDLSESQLFKLETIRNGGGIRFRLIVTGYASGHHGNASVRDELQFEATLSDWVRVLDEVSYSDVLVFGMELPESSTGERLAPARDMVVKARADLIAGRYDAVVSRCRNALESVQIALGEKDKSSSAVETFCKGPRRAMTKLEREWLVCEAVRHYSHLAHHVDGCGEPEWYSRSDATFLLALAAAVVSNAVARGG